MKRIKVLLILLSAMVLLVVESNAQVAINSSGATANSSAMLDVSSTTKGMLIPRMSNAQRDAISSPAVGLIIYSTTDDIIYVNTSSPTPTWVALSSGGAGISSLSVNAPLTSTGGSNPTIGILTPLDVTYGGTGSSNASGARLNIGAATSGDNGDITSLSGLTTALSVDQGGTGRVSFTSGQILYGNGTTNIGVSSSFVWNSSNKYLGLNLSSPSHLIHLNGGAYCDGTGAWISGSDSTFKRNITLMKNYGLKEVLTMNPVTYIHKLDTTNRVQIGFIAQEMKKIVPEVVEGNEGSMGLAYDRLVPVLVNAIKDQQTIIKFQEDKIKDLEARLSAIEAMLKK